MGKCMSRQKSSNTSNNANNPNNARNIQRNHGPNNDERDSKGGLDHGGRNKRTDYGNPVLINQNYESCKGEDVENEINLNELNVLGENNGRLRQG